MEKVSCCIVACPLRRGQPQDDGLEAGLVPRKASCGIEAQGFHVHVDHLHAREALVTQQRVELGETAERGPLTPQAQPAHVRHVFEFCGGRRGGVKDPRLGTALLQCINTPPGEGRLLFSHSYQVFGLVRLVEADQAARAGPAKPLLDLLQSAPKLTSTTCLRLLQHLSGRCLGTQSLRASRQCRLVVQLSRPCTFSAPTTAPRYSECVISGKKHSLRRLELVGQSLLPTLGIPEAQHRRRGRPKHVLQVPARVLDELPTGGDPQVLARTLVPKMTNEGRDLPALTTTRTIS
mmetsp:Transcript_2597/g.5661  ORF Transcript_2597/g.5661 Transcript_2597/m.5661 type:complete len:292 (-) Transcript_2597:864-1739(-)